MNWGRSRIRVRRRAVEGLAGWWARPGGGGACWEMGGGVAVARRERVGLGELMFLGEEGGWLVDGRIWNIVGKKRGKEERKFSW